MNAQIALELIHAAGYDDITLEEVEAFEDIESQTEETLPFVIDEILANRQEQNENQIQVTEASTVSVATASGDFEENIWDEDSDSGSSLDSLVEAVGHLFQTRTQVIQTTVQAFENANESLEDELVTRLLTRVGLSTNGSLPEKIDRFLTFLNSKMQTYLQVQERFLSLQSGIAGYLDDEPIDVNSRIA